MKQNEEFRQLTVGSVVTAPAPAPPAGPVPRQVRAMGIRAALEWAFGVEHARLTFDDGRGDTGPGFGMEFLLMERALLGQEIDVSRGRSAPADDAELIAAAVQSALMRADAIWVADLARAGQTPWRGGLCPRVGPADWVCGRGLWRGKTADARDVVRDWPVTDTPWGSYAPGRADPVRRRNRLGRIVTEQVFCTPLRWEVTAAQVAAARRRYLDWWGHLLTIRVALAAVDLRWVEITDAMPPMTPWIVGVERFVS